MATSTCATCKTDFDSTLTSTGRPHKRCAECRAKQAANQARHRARHPRSTADYQRELMRRNRVEALQHYGGRCECCGVSDWQFLTFDHPEGGGAKHRADIATRGSGFVSWLRQNNFPPGYRVLCHNCNSAIGYYGSCPHAA